MTDVSFEGLEDSAHEFRERVEAHDWLEADAPLLDAIEGSHDTPVGLLGRMAAYHGTLPVLVEGIQHDGLRGDFQVLQDETMETFNDLLQRYGNPTRPDVRHTLELHYFRPDSPVYVTTEASTPSIYGFPEASRFVLQSLVHASRWPQTPQAETQRLEQLVSGELERLLANNGDTHTAVITLDASHPVILKRLTNVEQLARISDAADTLEPRVLYGALQQNNLAIYEPIPAGAVTEVEIVKRAVGSWRETILSGKGYSVLRDPPPSAS